MTRAWVGMGSNQGDRKQQLDQALKHMHSLPDTQLQVCSSFYSSAPWGDTDQDDFTNAVAMLETDLEPQALLSSLQEIEKTMGRIRAGTRWGPRCIDLDLLMYSDVQIDTDSLTVPHPRMHKRAFVLIPLLELEPEILIPGKGWAKAYLAEVCDQPIARLDYQPYTTESPQVQQN